MKSKSTTPILILFALGIFMGAIDNGIVSPAREIIQNSFGVARNTGMWMITLYTLIYAVSMPIVSKMADRYGHKKVYTVGIAVFGFGSLLCGLSNFYGNFTFFLGARVIQAIGAGGILPIATTVIGLSFPEEKRGTALGFVGAIFGVATIIGPTIGSGILSISGTEHWGWIFFINVPLSIIILSLSFYIKNTKVNTVKPLDLIGSLVTAGVIGSLMYALMNMDFFNFMDSIKTIKVFPYLIVFAILIPILIYVENRAADPILNIKYFKRRQTLVIFILAFIVGVGMMGMIFVPQFAENTLKLKPGTGGYIITLLAVFSGFSAPISGKLVDKKGAKLVMAMGFLFNILGILILAYVATTALNFTSILIGVAFMGFGVGFTMGAPLNFLILQAVPKEEGTTALATMSLIRSIGVAISPSLMIGFIIDASKNLQPQLMSVLQQGFKTSMPAGMSMPMNFDGNAQASKLFQSLQTADITNIVDKLKNIFKQIIPVQAQGIVVQGIEKMRVAIEGVFQSTLNLGYTHMFTATAIIAAIGLFSTIFLKNKKNVEPNKEL